MSKAFPTKTELAKTYKQWALWLVITGAVLWMLTYYYCMMLIYGYICPLILGASVYNSIQTLRNQKTTGGWLLLIGSIFFLIISLLPWFLPIAR